MKRAELVNQGLTFVLELAGYASIVTWVAVSAATASLPTLARAVLAVLAVGAMATAWGLLAAPKASMRLHGAARVVFEVAWFGVGVITVWSIGAHEWGVLFIVMLILNTSLRAAVP